MRVTADAISSRGWGERRGGGRVNAAGGDGGFPWRFRRGFDKPEALVPGRSEGFGIDLHQINCVFKRGHRIGVQVQSS